MMISEGIMPNKATKFLFLFVTWASLSTPAYAYLDAATGSMILQAIIGGFAAALMYYRIFVGKFKDFFKRTFQKSK